MSNVADTFNRANQTGLGTSSDGTWAWSAALTGTAPNIVSNQCVHQGAVGCLIRAEVDLSSLDQFAQFVWSADTGLASVDQAGPCVRFSAAATTCYFLIYKKDGSSVRILKTVAGVNTTLATVTSQTALSNGDVLRLEVVGSALTGRRNGVSVVTVTDSSLPTGNRSGIFISAGASNQVTLDSFAAGAQQISGTLTGAGGGTGAATGQVTVKSTLTGSGGAVGALTGKVTVSGTLAGFSVASGSMVGFDPAPAADEGTRSVVTNVTTGDAGAITPLFKEGPPPGGTPVTVVAAADAAISSSAGETTKVATLFAKVPMSFISDGNQMWVKGAVAVSYIYP